MANEVVIPTDIRPESPERVELLDDQTVSFEPQFGRGYPQRNTFGDPRWLLNRRYRGLRQADMGRLRAVLGEALGGYRTVMLSPAQTPRGTWESVVGGELLSNPYLASGSTGFADGSGYDGDVSDQVWRSVRNASASTYPLIGNAPGVACTQYLPVLARAHVRVGRGGYTSLGIYVGASNADPTWGRDAGTGSASGLYQCSGVAQTASAFLTVVDLQSSNIIAGDFVENNFLSLAHCPLLDGGGNTLLWSDEPTNAAWTKGNSTASDPSAVAPDGQSDAELLTENGATSSHYLSQSGVRASGAAWVCAYGVFKRNSGTRNVRIVAGNTSSNYSHAILDLGAGTIGTVANVGTATLGRAFVRAMGNSWYFGCVLSYNVSATTTYAEFDMASGTSVSYTGDGSSSIYCWRMGCTPSGSPTMGTQTTSAAVAAAAQSGPVVAVKGLPASQSGLLLPGDWVSIDGQLKQLTARLDSDSAGLGTLHVRPRVAREVASDEPVAVTRPLGRFVLAGNASWDATAGLYNDFDLKFKEVYA